MKKLQFRAFSMEKAKLKKLLMLMKLTICLTMIAVMQVHAVVHSQESNFTINESGTKIREIIKELEYNSNYRFFYSENLTELEERVDINVFNAGLNTVLDRLFDKSTLTYKILDNDLVIIMPVTEDVLQGIRVSGKINDTDGTPLPGVNIVEVGTTNGAVSDLDGNYSITVSSEDATLRFSFVGYLSEEIKVGGQTNIDLTMIEDIQSLDEVVVVGYGTQKKVSVTSAVNTVTEKELISKTTSNIQQSLQGYVPGLVVIDQGGSPGNPNIEMRVRGVTTLDNKNAPLVIVDGIEQPLEDLNPYDIESISLLKDAASTAIYGSRGATGVLLITTKRATGEDGKVSVSYNGHFALQTANNKPEHLGLEAYLKQQQIAYTNSGINLPEKFTDEGIDEYLEGHANDKYKYPLPNTMHGAVLSTAPQHNHNLSFSAGSKFVKTMASLRYLYQDGIIANSNSEIPEVRLNNDFTISPDIKISTDFNYRNKQYRQPYEMENEVFTHLLLGSQWAVPKYPDGTYGVSSLGNNPLFFAEAQGYRNYDENYMLGNVKLEWKIIKGLELSVQYGKLVNYYSQKRYKNLYDIEDSNTGGKQINRINELEETRNRFNESTLNSLLKYSIATEEHKIDFLGGFSEVDHKNSDIWAYRQNFYNNDIQSINAGVNDETKDNNGRDYEWALRSFFGRINYSYKEKYLIEFSSRYDGSSRFTGDNLYGYFPSFSAGWRVSEETFWNNNLSNTINDFKIRGSWGQTGNQQIDLYSFYRTLAGQGYVIDGSFATGYTQIDMANQDISWETTTQINLGIDAYLLNNKYSLSFDYYHKRTDDILLLLPVPSILGLDPSYQNAGRVDNTGYEILLNTHQQFNEVRFDATLQFSYNKNEVIDLAGTGPYITGGRENRKLIAEGYPINTLWGYVADGYFQTEEELENYPTLQSNWELGDVKYVDLNNDGKITADDMTDIGSTFPEFTGSATFNIAYKGFELNVLFQGVTGVDAIIGGAIAEMGIWEGFTVKDLENNYWTPENRNADYPRPLKRDVRNLQGSSRDVWDGSYIRLKNARLLYNIPSNLSQKVNLKNIDVYLSSTNVFTFAELNKLDLDPEVRGATNRTHYYPQTSLVTLGLNVNF